MVYLLLTQLPEFVHLTVGHTQHLETQLQIDAHQIVHNPTLLMTPLTCVYWNVLIVLTILLILIVERALLIVHQDLIGLLMLKILTEHV